MKKKEYIHLIIALLFCSAISAQSDIQLLANWDYTEKENAFEKVNKVITSFNGYTIAVGETIGDSFKDVDGLFLVLEPETGKPHLWKKFGGRGNDVFNSVIQNNDGTFTLVGYSQSYLNATREGWLVQLDMEGNVLYEERLPNKDKTDNELIDLAANADGAVMAVGMKNWKNASEIWILAIENQAVIADRTIGNGELGRISGLVAAPDGNFVLAGSTDLKNRQHPSDAWIMKVDKEGTDLWGGVRFFGDGGFQEAGDISRSTADGGYVLAGSTGSKGAGSVDMWLLKISEEGEMEWDKTYGGDKEDVSVAVIELSEGGYAILGQTRSHMPRAPRFNQMLVVVDAAGEVLDSGTFPIVEGEGEESAHSLVELFSGDNLVIAGSRVPYPDKVPSFPNILLSSITYKHRPVPSRTTKDGIKDGETDSDRYSAPLNTAFKLTRAEFFDPGQDKALDPGERGYFALEITNESKETLYNVSGSVSTEQKTPVLEFWDDIKLGTIRAGQTKRLVVPVYAKGDLPDGDYDFFINVKVGETYATSTMTRLSSYKPDPPRLVVNDHYFSPEHNPKPGEPIRLKVELVNTGGLASESVQANFSLPRGVRSLDYSQEREVPSLRPGEKFGLELSFSFDPNYSGSNIPVTFEISGRGTTNPVRNTFPITLGNLAQVQRSGPVNATSSGDVRIRITDPSPGSNAAYKTTKENVSVRATILSNGPLGQSKDKFEILVNGNKTQGQKMDEVKLKTASKDPSTGEIWHDFQHSVLLEEGLNKIEIVYYDEDGINIITRSQSVVVHYTDPGKPNLWVVSIGVPYDNLKYTVKDAEDFAKLYESLKEDQSGRGFKNVEVYTNTTKESTSRLWIEGLFEELTTRSDIIKENDLLVVFLSAHGKVGKDGDYILMPSDYNSEKESTYSINFEEHIVKHLRKVPCTKLVFIDACHSGNAFDGAKGFTDQQWSKMMNDLIDTLNTNGMEIFASCSDNEYSYEDESWGNGAFTKAIKEAFQNEEVEVAGGEKTRADIYSDDPATGTQIIGGDGVITIHELKQFLTKRVPHMVKETKNMDQHPSNKSTELLRPNKAIYMVVN